MIRMAAPRMRRPMLVSLFWASSAVVVAMLFTIGGDDVRRGGVCKEVIWDLWQDSNMKIPLKM